VGVDVAAYVNCLLVCVRVGGCRFVWRGGDVPWWSMEHSTRYFDPVGEVKIVLLKVGQDRGMSLGVGIWKDEDDEGLELGVDADDAGDELINVLRSLVEDDDVKSDELVPVPETNDEDTVVTVDDTETNVSNEDNVGVNTDVRISRLEIDAGTEFADDNVDTGDMSDELEADTSKELATDKEAVEEEDRTDDVGLSNSKLELPAPSNLDVLLKVPEVLDDSVGVPLAW
jgi:hypothetical protein